MSTVPTASEPLGKHELYHYYVCTFGSIISIVIVSAIFIHILYHYKKIFHSKNNDGRAVQSRSVYILFFMYSITSIITSCFYAFIRTNIFTQQSIKNITWIQCEIGYIGAIICTFLAQVFLYSLLVTRIRIAFHDSVYKYSSKIYLTLNIVLVTVISICIGMLFVWYTDINYKIDTFENTNYIYCTSFAKSNTKKEDLNLINTGLYVGLVCIYNMRDPVCWTNFA